MLPTRSLRWIWQTGETFCTALQKELTDRAFGEEMLLQCQVIDSGGSEERINKRLWRISKAARLYLDRAKFFTSLGWFNPLIHWWERLWLRRFVCNLLRLERELAHETHLRHATWRIQYEEGLMNLVSSRGDRFQEILTYDQLPPPVQRQVVQGIARELDAPTNPNVSQQIQMQ